MRKIIAKIGFLLIGLAMIAPNVVSAAYNTVAYSTASDILLTGSGITLTVSASSNVNSITVYPTYISVVLERDATDVSSIIFTSNDRYNMDSSDSNTTTCGTSSSTLTLTGPATVTTTTVTVRPEAILCSSSGGTTGGSTTPSSSSTTTTTTTTTETTEPTTGTETVTASAGGTATAVSAEGSEATVQVPANAVSADTVVTVTPVGAADSLAGSPPSGSVMVGGYVYQFTATADSQAVTEFDADLTLTFTYTDSQVEGVDESSLVVYYWDSDTSAWVALESTVDAGSNTITATTNHLTDFAIIGEEEETAEDAATIAELEAQIAELQTLIANAISQLTALLGYSPVGGITGIPADFSFTTNIALGAVGNDAKYLQIVLNSDAATKVAATGVGSPGYETNYFGSLTKAAVIKFQEKYSSVVLDPWGFSNGTGFVGSTTREKLNSLLGK